ncbi:MAG: hypothetical protein JW700_00670 [Candidatus Aenigmarchaeota archaeon]|nr:hypothetical protein [Candidatus Aenigmarchaeota archaeon]
MQGKVSEILSLIRRHEKLFVLAMILFFILYYFLWSFAYDLMFDIHSNDPELAEQIDSEIVLLEQFSYAIPALGFVLTLLTLKEKIMPLNRLLLILAILFVFMMIVSQLHDYRCRWNPNRSYGDTCNLFSTGFSDLSVEERFIQNAVVLMAGLVPLFGIVLLFLLDAENARKNI